MHAHAGVEMSIVVQYGVVAAGFSSYRESQDRGVGARDGIRVSWRKGWH